jgi:ribosome biogenesis GTPase
MFDAIHFARLQSIGLTPRLLQSIPPLAEGDLPMRVVWPSATGCWPSATCMASGGCTQRVPPVTQIARRLHDGRDKVTRTVIVSNVDTALLVMGLDHDFKPAPAGALPGAGAPGRCLGGGGADQGRPVRRRAAARLRSVQALLPPDTVAVAVNALGDEPPPQLAPWLREGSTLVLLGSSGAGKSTLTNALLAGAGAGHRRHARGRRPRPPHHHRAVAALTPGGACIIDTPGLRTLRLDGDAGAIGAVFDDIAQLAPAVPLPRLPARRRARLRGARGVPPERLRNYHKLLREASATR